MSRYRWTFRCNESVEGKSAAKQGSERNAVFQGLFFPVGDGEGGWRPYGYRAVCMYWDLTAAERGVRVCVS